MLVDYREVPIQMKRRTRCDQVGTAGPSTGMAALGPASSSAPQAFPRDAGCLLGTRCSGTELLSLQAAWQNCQRFAAVLLYGFPSRDHSLHSLTSPCLFSHCSPPQLCLSHFLSLFGDVSQKVQVPNWLNVCARCGVEGILWTTGRVAGWVRGSRQPSLLYCSWREPLMLGA